MKLKTVEVNGATYAEVKDGLPVVIEDDGRETTFDIPKSITKIRETGKESKALREAKEALEAKLGGYEGIDDPEEARKALEFKRNAKEGDFVAAGKVDEIKAGLKRTYDEQYAATNKANAEKVKKLEASLADVTGKYNRETVSNAFGNSKFIREKAAVPIGMLQATFGGQFKVDNGKLVAHHADGSPIMSASGDPASFDEAIERIVTAYPDRDMILKGSQSSGSGARGGTGGAGAGTRTITRGDYNSKPLPEQRAMALAANKGELVITE